MAKSVHLVHKGVHVGAMGRNHMVSTPFGGIRNVLFFFFELSDYYCPFPFWVDCSSHRESFENHSLSINCHQT